MSGVWVSLVRKTYNVVSEEIDKFLAMLEMQLRKGKGRDKFLESWCKR